VVDGATYTQTISYSFGSWGETTVDGDEYTEPSAWRSYFDFDNVTITETKTYDINGTPQTSELGTVWKIVGDKWLCIQDAASVDGTVVAQHIAYFDGTNSYLTNFDMTGALVESISSYHYTSEYLMGNLPALEDRFEKTEQGNQIIYSANSIILYDIFTYTNVRVVVENGCIVSIEYTVPNMMEADGIMYPGAYMYEFSAYGATTIDYIVPDHACHYTEEVATDTYLCHSATCEVYASYYYSCACGNKGWNTFYYGEYGECSYGVWHSNNDGTHSKICSYNNSHILTEDCYGGAATCEHPAICEGCGAEYGEIGQHDYSLEVEDDRFLISHCGEYAEYYKSCACGLRGEEKFYRDAWEICDYGFWVSNGDGTHTRTCSRNPSHTETENCSGGSATCENLAICDYCETEYGDFAEHVWSDGVCVNCGQDYYNTGLLFELSSDKTYYSLVGVGTCTDENIIIPRSYRGLPVTHIGDDAFEDYTALTSLQLTNNILMIERNAFYGCYNINKIDFSGDVNDWATILFETSSSNPTIYAKDLYINGNLLTEAVLTDIGYVSDFAFYGCNSLSSVTIPVEVKSIGVCAFYLTNVSNVKYAGTIDDWVTLNFGESWCVSRWDLFIDDTQVNLH